MTKKKEKIKPETFPRRRERLFDRMADGAALVPSPFASTRADGLTYPFRPDMDFYYLTGLDEPGSAALFLKNGDRRQFMLFVSPRDPEQERWTGEMIGLDGARETYGADEAYPMEELEEKLTDVLAGREQVYYPFGRYQAFDDAVTGAIERLREHARNRKRPPGRIKALSDLLHPMRRIKSPEEIELHRRAIELTWKGLMRAIKMCAPGRFEYELEAVLDGEFRRRGGDGPAFETIVAGGKNATVLHYQENEDRLNTGEMVLIDAGASYQYHCADITRTIPVDGTFTRAQQQFYEVVLGCQQEVIQFIEPGVSYDELQRKTVRLLTRGMVDLGLLDGPVDEIIDAPSGNGDDETDTGGVAPYKRFFMHKIGHWLGLQAHDVGAYRAYGTEEPGWETLQPGMLLTVEPGLYVPPEAEDVPERFAGMGVRIEDDVLVTGSGCEVLSKRIPKEVEELEERL